MGGNKVAPGGGSAASKIIPKSSMGAKTIVHKPSATSTSVPKASVGKAKVAGSTGESADVKAL